jgi:hypothetical protein
VKGAALSLAAALLATACGYTLVGRSSGSDPSIKRIGVPLFKDDTGKAGLDQKVTDEVIQEILRRGRFDVVQGATNVDATVTGEILSYRATPVGFSQESADTTQASRYAIVLTARVTYSKTGATAPIWQNDSFLVRDEYDVGDSSESFFDREDQAIDRLATAFARSLVAAMFEAF